MAGFETAIIQEWGWSFLSFDLLVKLFSQMIVFALHASAGGSFPEPLKKAEEEKLLKEYEEGSVQARDKLIEHNLRLVAHIVKKYGAKAGYEQDDLISIGTIGLIKAVTTFKADKGIRLATYAARCIENEILMQFRNAKKTSLEVFIDDPIDSDQDGNVLTLMDIIADDENIDEKIDYKIKLTKLRNSIAKKLTPRERTIIELRYGLTEKGELTQKTIAAKLGISRSYVSRIEKSALEKLRREF